MGEEGIKLYKTGVNSPAPHVLPHTLCTRGVRVATQIEIKMSCVAK